jgi:hypothetical protein
MVKAQLFLPTLMIFGASRLNFWLLLKSSLAIGRADGHDEIRIQLISGTTT